MKILNLYAGIGGNRKLWEGHDVTAVEINPDIARVYARHFPQDKLIIGDAHQYLLNHYSEFDFIWASCPCPSHSRANFWASKTAENRTKYYPDMTLYQEVLFLKHWFKGKWLAENVIPYYEPLITPTVKIGRHLFWSNFNIPAIPAVDTDIHKGKRESWSEALGFDISNDKMNKRKDQVYRNCVHPEIGLHILNCTEKIEQTLFEP
jgi:DNA (cytosine-5)-methyltransferase 1